jgi:hypothetical protein
MKILPIVATFAAAAALCFAAVEPRVSRATLTAVEGTINQTFAPRGPDSYDVLGTARGTYLAGYGALFTIELDLANAGPLDMSPFRPAMSPAEIAAIRERKLKKVPVLKETMRNILVNASGTMEGLPPNERIAMEAILFNFRWEDSKGLPRRVFMSAEKQKLLDAKAAHAGPAELAAVMEKAGH